MTEHAPYRIWSDIDIPKTIAGVLAAVSAAVVGSYLGVAGTLIGAAVASLVGSVGTEIYHRWIARGSKKIRGTFLAPAAVGTPPVAAAAEDSPSAPAPPRKMRWKRVAMVAAALFVLAIGTLTVAELVAGRSIADTTRGGSGDGTTVSSLFNDKSGNSEESTPTDDSSTSPEETTQPTDEPTQQDTDTTEPTQQATTEPTTDAPTGNSGDTTDSGSGTDSSTGSGGGLTDNQGADTQNPNDGTE